MSPGRNFLVNASTLMSGTLVAQALNFALSFALTRLYSPAEYGHYSIFAGCAAILAAASTGALDRVIVLGKNDREARKAASTVIFLSTASALCICMCGIIFELTGILEFLPLESADLIIFIPFFMVCYAVGQVLVYSSLRHHASRQLAALKVGQSAMMGAVQVGLASFKSLPGLVVGNIAGWCVMAVAGLRWRWRVGHVRSDLKLRSIRALIARHWRYPRYIMPNEALDNLSNQAPVFLIGTFLSLSTAGHYGLAIMLLSAPAAVVGQAVGQAFLQYMGRYAEDPRVLRSTMCRIWAGMAAVGIVPFGVIFVFGPVVCGWAFGPKWVEAGAVAQLLAPLLLTRLVSSPTSSIYLKLGLQREQWRFCMAAAMYRTAVYGLSAFGVSLTNIIIIHVTIEVSAIILYNWIALHRLSGLAGQRERIA